jgi:hypothetical protein
VVSSTSWQAIGPVAVETQSFGLISGRVTALVPADPAGNCLYVGTTGGGVWLANDAGTSSTSSITFNPLTDTVAALTDMEDASISIGALTVEPGTVETCGSSGIILAGTGDPNDALDSYYGAGILRSADGGNTWSLIRFTADQRWGFRGEGFAGFAWGTVNGAQWVVAAVSQAYEGTLVNAVVPTQSYEGLYYSSDGGATWNLANITDVKAGDVQGPNSSFTVPDGNAATSVAWNPARKLFVAAVRFHGYYQSADGVNFTRMAAQPGSGLSASMCPTNPGIIGSTDCPIFRGTLAVNPQTGDTFAWTTDIYNQNQGLWQDPCVISNAGVCTTQSIAFPRRLSTAALEANTANGAYTIENGDYTLALAAAPSGLGQGQDTILLAGDDDLWRCSLAEGCVWRNTTNATTCMSAQVAAYQHTLAWSTGNPLQMFVGNDGGLWRSEDGIGYYDTTDPVCSPNDATHFQNLNGSLGSLAEVVSMSQTGATPYTLMTGLGVNGTAGVKGGSEPTGPWPEILGGEGGPVAIDPINATNWYVNNEAGVSIYLCAQPGDCTPAEFGTTAAVDDSDVGGDGYTMTTPAPFLVDPLDSTQLLIGTCRVWRGPASGIGWSAGNAISPVLDDQASSGPCSGDSLIRSMAALPLPASGALPSGGEAVYVGMFGALDVGGTSAGHLWSAIYNTATNGWSAWVDLTLNPVTNDSNPLNYYAFDISSIFIDAHDATGNTVYATVEGNQTTTENVIVLYGSTDGGAHWASMVSNLPPAPANSVVVDPEDANTVYVATDAGVWSTRTISYCVGASSNCWSAFGSGLPMAPVVQLSASPATSSAQALVAATYGRGVWQIPLWTAGTQPVTTTATATPASLTFASQLDGTPSSAQTITITNTGSDPLTPTAIAISGDFSETNTCINMTVLAGLTCAIQVIFTPTQAGSRTGQLIVSADVLGGQLPTVALSGTGAASAPVSLSPATVSFGDVEVGIASLPLQITVQNSTAAAVPITGISIGNPFSIASNACGTTSLAAQTACQLTVVFTPSQAGLATGTLTFTDGAGTQTVALSGTGEAPPTDSLSVTTLSFPATIDGQLSTAETVTLTNSGGVPLTGIAISASGAFTTSNNCTTQLAANSSCTISVVFAPTAVGAQTGTLTVSDLLRTQTVALSGTGLQPPAFGVTPASLTFSTQDVGVASQPQTVTIGNTGGAPMANVGFQITGSSASSFAMGVTTCGATLANGSSCTAQVIFTPAASGANAATLTISSSTLGAWTNVVYVPLNGAGTAAAGLNVNPSQLTFALVFTGQSSATQMVTVSNSGSTAASSLTLTVAAPFSLTQNSCPSSLAGGASCTVGVIFTPTAIGAATGILTVTSATVTAPANVALSGTGGVTAALQVTPASITFAGTTGVGATSSPTTVTITNPGSTQALSNLTLAVTGGFQLVSNNCGETLAAQSSCTAGVEFAPIGSGTQTGSLTVSSSTVTNPAIVPLTGMGFNFALAVSGSSTQTVANGQTANYSLTITPSSGLVGSFTYALQCGTGLPSYTTCSIPGATGNTVTINGSNTDSVAVEIATGVSATARLTAPGRWGLLPVACGLVLLPLGWRRRRRALLPIALAAILTGGVSSCSGSGGGGGGGGGGGNTTPAGTYTIPFSVTSTGVTRSVNLTLTVD